MTSRHLTSTVRFFLFAAIAVCLTPLLSGCGGGGGGGSSASPPPEGPILVTGITRPSPGSSLSADLNGTFSSEGESLDANATLSSSVGDETTFDNQAVFPINSSVTIRIPSTGDVVNSGGITYVTADGSRVGGEKDNGVTCFADSSSPLPSEVNIGDSGMIGTFTCSDGTSESQRFRVEAGDGTLDFVITIEVSDGSSSLSEVVTYRFVSDNEIAFIRDEGSLRSNGRTVSFNLSGEVTSSNL